MIDQSLYEQVKKFAVEAGVPTDFVDEVWEYFSSEDGVEITSLEEFAKAIKADPESGNVPLPRRLVSHDETLVFLIDYPDLVSSFLELYREDFGQEYPCLSLQKLVFDAIAYWFSKWNSVISEHLEG